MVVLRGIKFVYNRTVGSLVFTLLNIGVFSVFMDGLTDV